MLVERDADAILAALGLTRAALGTHLVTVAVRGGARGEPREATGRASGSCARTRSAPSVRALAWGASALFGVERVGTLARLAARRPACRVPADAPPTTRRTPGPWSPGGDILLDRGVSLAIQGSKRGANFPFDGGTVAITGHCKDCSPFGWDLPYTKRTGNVGVVRELVKGADIAIANFENPAPNKFRWHGKGIVFSANPKHIAGLVGRRHRLGLARQQPHRRRRAQRDRSRRWQNLDDYGITHGGAGKNTTAAHKATLLKAGGVTVGILGYDTIAPATTRRRRHAGQRADDQGALKADIKAAPQGRGGRRDRVPALGRGVPRRPTGGQRTLGHAAIDAGADLVIGNHPHWAEGMEVYKGKPIWYALGNFVFDQTWSEPTMEGITLELTFRGKELVQARMRPHLILGKAQPNFMDPAGSAARW